MIKRGDISIKKAVFAAVVVLLAAIAVAILFFRERVEEGRLERLSDILSTLLRSELSQQKADAMSLCLAIAQNSQLADMVEHNDRDGAYRTLDALMSSLEKAGQKKQLWIQIHDPSLRVFLRSWDKTDYGTQLESFRKGLVQVRDSQKPFVSIELGKKLNIKAIAPIFKNGQYVGSIEVIKNFDEMVERFRQNGISLLVLMDERHLKIAEWMEDYARVDDFVVAHRSFDQRLSQQLEDMGLYRFIGFRRTMTDEFLVAVEPIRDLLGERLGFYVLGIDRSRAQILASENRPTLLTIDSSQAQSEEQPSPCAVLEKKTGEIR